MQPAPSLPGRTLSPLFSPLFAIATAANALLSWDPLAPALVVAWAAAHIAFLLRIVTATRACRGQRAADLAPYQSLRNSGGTQAGTRPTD